MIHKRCYIADGNSPRALCVRRFLFLDCVQGFRFASGHSGGVSYTAYFIDLCRVVCLSVRSSRRTSYRRGIILCTRKNGAGAGFSVVTSVTSGTIEDHARGFRGYCGWRESSWRRCCFRLPRCRHEPSVRRKQRARDLFPRLEMIVGVREWSARDVFSPWTQ